MAAFRVFYVLNGSGGNVEIVETETPNTAADAIRKQYPGAIVTKVKVNRSK